MTEKDLTSLFEKTGVISMLDQYYMIIVDSVFVESVREKFVSASAERCSLWETLEKIGVLSFVGDGFQVNSKCFIDDVRSKIEMALSSLC